MCELLLELRLGHAVEVGGARPHAEVNVALAHLLLRDVGWEQAAEAWGGARFAGRAGGGSRRTAPLPNSLGSSLQLIA